MSKRATSKAARREKKLKLELRPEAEVEALRAARQAEAAAPPVPAPAPPVPAPSPPAPAPENQPTVPPYWTQGRT